MRQYNKPDKTIRSHIPSGREVNSEFDETSAEQIYNDSYYNQGKTSLTFKEYMDAIERVCKKTGQKNELSSQFSGYTWRRQSFY
jgi:Ca2+-binding EF-hand superfamily protein